MTEPTIHRTPTVCDTDAAKRALLEQALADPEVRSQAQALVPAGEVRQPGPFEYARALRGENGGLVLIASKLPPGLEATDFDGVNIDAALGA